MRAMSRRTWRTRAVFSSWPLACWNRKLNDSRRSLSSSSFSWSGVLARRSAAFMGSFPLAADAADEARLHRQFGGGQRKGLLGHFPAHPVQFEHDAARLDPCGPPLRRALAGPHAHFLRLLGDGDIRKNADPELSDAAHVPRDGPARGFDLASRDTTRRGCLQAIGTKVQLRAALCHALDPALMLLAVLRPLRRQHGSRSLKLLDRITALLTSAAAAARLRFRQPLVLRHGIVGHHLALEDPYLHATGTIGRVGGRFAIVDIRAQGVQRHAPFAIPLRARNLGTAQPAAAVDPNALGPKPHGVLHRALHRPAESHASLQLLRDVFRDQLGIDLRLADFDDVQVHIAAGHLREVLTELLDVGALLPDHHAGAGRVDRHPRALCRTLDHDARHARLLQPLVEKLPQLQVIVQHLAVVLAREPAGVPRAIDAQAQADRIYFLTHSQTVSSRSRTTRRNRLHGLMILPTRPRARGRKRFMVSALPTLA